MTRSKRSQHKMALQLRAEFPRPMRRTCALPVCSVTMTVDLFGPEPGFRAPSYCSKEHQAIAVNHRKKLRRAIERIDELMGSRVSLHEANRGQPVALTRAQLLTWKRRLEWELAGMAN